MENRLRIHRFRTVCLTGSRVDSFCGLPGLLLSSSNLESDAEHQGNHTIIGPPLLNNFLSEFRSFVDPLKDVNIDCIPVDNQNKFEECYSVASKLKLYKKLIKITSSTTKTIHDEENSPLRKKPKFLGSAEEEEYDFLNVFVVELPDTPPKLNMQKIKSLGLKSKGGEWLGKLKGGQRVSVEGIELDPLDYLEGGSRGVRLMVTDLFPNAQGGCSTLIDDAVAQFEHLDYCFVLNENPGSNEQEVIHKNTKIIYVASKDGVPHDPLRTFSLTTCIIRDLEPHFLCPLPELLEDQLVKRLDERTLLEVQEDVLSTLDHSATHADRPVPLRMFDVSHLSPCDPANPSFACKWRHRDGEKEELADLLEWQRDLKEQISHIPQEAFIKSSPEDHLPRLVLLGSASAMPSKMRGVSGSLLLVPNVTQPSLASPSWKTGRETVVVVDPGEGSLSGWVSCRGKRFVEDIRNLGIIAVTHAHADHNVGIFAIIQKWTGLVRDGSAKHRKIVLLGPKFMENWFKFGFNNLKSGLRWDDSVVFFSSESVCAFRPSDELLAVANGETAEGRLAPSLEVQGTALGQTHFEENSFKNAAEVSEKIRKLIGIGVQSCLVPHVRASFGFKFVGRGFERGVAFSGDCEKSEDLVKLAANSQLLVHESTFCVAHASSACHTRHSCVADALEVAHSSGTDCLVLSHFSQRYPILEEQFLEEGLEVLREKDLLKDFKRFAGKVIIGFDHIMIPVFDRYKGEEQENRIAQYAQASHRITKILARAKEVRTNRKVSHKKEHHQHLD
eukprot:GDKJ01044394.1.p1 GENE.GDKJ01044394.1~~GDKJ01044394.1.p1  ORF type:complete len:858 (-),score=165.30 GDKJ01044394.1:429-2783(-)